jgi:tRNA-splicing ligase RtcB
MLVIQGEKVPIKAWVDGVELEAAARSQLHNLAGLPFIHSHIAVMPDVHMGYGATVGSVIPTIGAIIPAAVGVDIGCGMMAVRTSLTASDLPDNLHDLRTQIEQRIPHGRTNDGQTGDRGAWGDVTDAAKLAWFSIPSKMAYRLADITEKHPEIAKAAERAPHHLGTLGGGNHFVEVCLDLEDRVWIMLHSGSRGIGNRIGTYFTNLAKAEMKRWFINLPDRDLAYFPEGNPLFDDYIEAMLWGQDFAMLNRALMMKAALEALAVAVPRAFTCDEQAVNCHHNMCESEHHFGKQVWLTRKGAVRARKGDLGIIPGSMGARSFIVEGLGNPQSFSSCSHGAGRRMSRTQAKSQFTVDDLIAQTQGIECRHDEDVVDEIPAAYKSIEDVMAAQADLVKVRHELHQVVCVKG